MSPVYGILDGAVLAQRNLDVVSAAEALIEGGIRLVQLRWKQSYTREVYASAVQIARLCRDADVAFVINDRADVARLLDAGVHTGQDDLPVAAVRQIAGSACLIGVSTHSESQFTEAVQTEPSYIALGPIYGTVSKDRPDPIVGTETLARVRRHFEGPVVAIGGITRILAPEVWRAGADSVAVIGDLYPGDATKASVRERAEEWIQLANEQCSRSF
ncbi:MAG: thiamine phosphate synthase [Bryobacteraceae bacterium]|nr:thiamine phosphate synthase [Bryobacteraceae bacterium]